MLFIFTDRTNLDSFVGIKKKIMAIALKLFFIESVEDLKTK